MQTTQELGIRNVGTTVSEQGVHELLEKLVGPEYHKRGVFNVTNIVSFLTENNKLPTQS